MSPMPPFNTASYGEGLTHIGVSELHASGRFFVLRRPIAGTPHVDGAGPWPYLWVQDDEDLRALHEDFRHLVTLAVVTQPGYIPAARGSDAVLLKQHFVYDPALPPPALSRRCRSRLRRCEAVGAFEQVTGPEMCRLMTELHGGLIHRRGLTGGLFDVSHRHFEVIAGLANSVFVRVVKETGVGAMACGVFYGDMLQILHTAISLEGLQWNASYLLMHGLQTLARERGVRLLTGGLPDGASDGLHTFKRRWANCFAPVYLLRIVNDQATYARLCATRTADRPYFPAYRTPTGGKT